MIQRGAAMSWWEEFLNNNKNKKHFRDWGFKATGPVALIRKQGD